MYNSHGGWSTLGKIRAEEEERENYFPKVNLPPSTPAIWVCQTRELALRYLALAERWDDIAAGRLTSEDKELLSEIQEIPVYPNDRIVHDDGDEGYLLVRPH